MQCVSALECLPLGPGVPLDQLEDGRAARQVAADRGLLAVDAGHSSGPTSVDQLDDLAVQRPSRNTVATGAGDGIEGSSRCRWSVGAGDELSGRPPWR